MRRKSPPQDPGTKHRNLGHPPSTILQKLKLRVARRLRKRKSSVSLAQIPLPFEAAREPRAFWQARFYDFNVYTRRKKIEKLHYMHANPVARGLANHPKDWPWSSWAYFYARDTARIRIDVEG